MRKASLVIASLIYLSFLGLGLYHSAVQNVPWTGFTPRANLVEYALAPLWIAGIVALWVPRGSVGVSLLYLTPLAAFAHGILVSIGGDATAGAWLTVGSLVAGLAAFRGHIYDRTAGVIRDTQERMRLGTTSPRIASPAA